MIRRLARERREYLYRKALESKDLKIAENKQKAIDAVNRGGRVPFELRGVSANELAYDEGNTDLRTNHEDDEYAEAGEVDPRLVITTCRNPSSRLLQFTKELSLFFPNCTRLNRGHYVMKDLVTAARSHGYTDMIVIHEHRGVPDGLVISHLPHGPSLFATLSNVKLRHDLEDCAAPMSLQFPHLIFHNFTTDLGRRVTSILKYLFPVPKDDSKRVISFINEDDYIKVRHHVFETIGKHAELAEVGPRWELSVYEIRLGTLDIPNPDVEWVARPYHRTAKKRTFL